MSPSQSPLSRILGIAPCHRGFGFAVLDTGERLLTTWGVAELYSDNAKELLVRVEALVDRYKPTMIALESLEATRKGMRHREAIASIERYAAKRDMATLLMSRADIRAALRLATSATNFGVASATTEFLPEIREYLPPKRQIWETERRVMNMFSAAALAYSTVAHAAQVAQR